MEDIFKNHIVLIPMTLLAVSSIFNMLIFAKFSPLKSRLSTGCVGISLISYVFALFCFQNQAKPGIFTGDSLSVLMTILILFISFIVHSFSIRYMFGEKDYSSFFTRLSLITLSLLILVNSNSFYLFSFFWIISNLLLLSLINFKHDWKAANQSTSLISKYLLFGSMSLFLSVYILNSFGIYNFTQLANNTSIQNNYLVLILLLLSALVQCSLIPFHGYLLNSLNAPTPVSALMHASLVNGGGFLLIRFSPIFKDSVIFMNLVFLLGAISAFLGVLWMLIKVDIKGILASSTISQMGFMFMQIGLGLFPAAISHLCMHGLFKSYLFLSSGSAINQKIKASNHDLCALIENKNILHVLSSAVLGIAIFLNCLKQDINLFSTKAIFIIFVFIFFFDIALNTFKTSNNFIEIMLKYSAIFSIALIYGSFMFFIDHYLGSSLVETLCPVNLIHCFVLGIFLFGYLAMIIKNNPLFIFSEKKFLQIFTFLVNNSQPNIQSATLAKKGF